MEQQQWVPPIAKGILKAAEYLGYPQAEYNGPEQIGK